MYAIRSYYGSEGFAEVGQRGNTRLPVKFWGDMPNAGNADQNTFVVRVKARITSYNVCYTKLLRLTNPVQYWRLNALLLSHWLA